MNCDAIGEAGSAVLADTGSSVATYAAGGVALAALGVLLVVLLRWRAQRLATKQRSN